MGRIRKIEANREIFGRIGKDWKNWEDLGRIGKISEELGRVRNSWE